MTIKLDHFVHLWNKLLQSLLRMHDAYILNQKFDSIKNLKKIIRIKNVKEIFFEL